MTSSFKIVDGKWIRLTEEELKQAIHAWCDAAASGKVMRVHPFNTDEGIMAKLWKPAPSSELGSGS